MAIHIGNNLHLKILKTFYFFIFYHSRKCGEKSKTFFDLKIREENNLPPLYIFEKKKKIIEKKEKKVTKKEEWQDQGSKLLEKDKIQYLDLDDPNFDFNLFSKYNNLFSDFNLIGNNNNNDYNYDNNNNNSNSNNNDSKNSNNYHNENKNKNNEMIVYDHNRQKNNNTQSTWWFDKYSET